MNLGNPVVVGLAVPPGEVDEVTAVTGLENCLDTCPPFDVCVTLSVEVILVVVIDVGLAALEVGKLPVADMLLHWMTCS